MPEEASGGPDAVLFRGQPCLRLELGPRDSVLVARQGAQLLSWVANGVERLYLSPRAVMDGASPIRGGVPVCFPQFNTRGTLPKHGFVRNLSWSLVPAERGQAHESAEFTLELASDAASYALWPASFVFQLRISLRRGTVEVALTARNTGDLPWSFTGALHTYLSVRDLGTLRIEGLDGQACWDSVTDARSVQQGDVAITGEYDRVFAAAPGALLLRDGGDRLHITQGSGFSDTVVWNPGAAKCAALADMPADGYLQMVCIEAAQVESPRELAPKAQWTGWQRLAVA